MENAGLKIQWENCHGGELQQLWKMKQTFGEKV